MPVISRRHFVGGICAKANGFVDSQRKHGSGFMGIDHDIFINNLLCACDKIRNLPERIFILEDMPVAQAFG